MGRHARGCFSWMMAVALVAAATLTAADGPYKLTTHTRLGFNVTSNTFDAANNRLYASTRDGVWIIDTRASKVLGQVNKTSGAGSVAFSPEHSELYLLSLHEDLMRVIDVTTRKVVRSFDAPAWFNVFYDGSRNELYYLRADTRDVRIADRLDGHTIKTLSLDGHPSSVLMDPARHRVIVRLADRDLIQIIDTNDRSISVSWPMTAEGQTVMAIDDTGNRLFVSSGKNVKMIDGQTGKEMSRISVGDIVRSIVYDPGTQTMAALWSQNHVRIAQVGTLGLSSVQDIDTRAAVRQLFLDPVSHFIYAVATLAETDVMGINANTSPQSGLRVSSLLTLAYKP